MSLKTKKFTSKFVLYLIFFSLLFAILNIEIVRAVVINSDGTINPSDAPIERDGDIYSLTDNIDYLVVSRSNITIDGHENKINGGADSAVRMLYVNNVTLRNCIITGADYGPLQVGIVLDYSSNCVISGNLITTTKHVNPKFWSTSGIHVSRGGSHIISGNYIINNQVGIHLGGSDVTDNIIVGNNIENNSLGIDIAGASNNIFYNNNFINNSLQISDMGISYPDVVSPSVNIWDDGVTGNYWSNYTGQDTNGDNIGDSPHFIYENNQDNYPLMTPRDIAVIPEFPAGIILPLFLMAMLFAVIIKKQVSHSKQNRNALAFSSSAFLSLCDVASSLFYLPNLRGNLFCLFLSHSFTVSFHYSFEALLCMLVVGALESPFHEMKVNSFRLQLLGSFA
jgi:parallel beta-helix repeat protein